MGSSFLRPRPVSTDDSPSLRQLWTDGNAAGLAGKPITSCPEDGRTVYGRMWREGWRAGKAQRDRITEAARAKARALLDGGAL